jgi:hypothetical protein
MGFGLYHRAQPFSHDDVIINDQDSNLVYVRYKATSLLAYVRLATSKKVYLKKAIVAMGRYS